MKGTMNPLRILALASIILAMVLSPTLALGQPSKARGATIYKEYCQTCHQANGQGLGTVFPPVAKSDYMAAASSSQIIKEVVNGKSGKVKVNGKEYNGVMAPLPAKYSAEDVAAVLTYVYGSFGNKARVFTAAEVRKAVPKRK